MSNYICRSCRASLSLTVSWCFSIMPTNSMIRNYSSNITAEAQASAVSVTDSKTYKRPSEHHVDITALLATPSWSVRSLLPKTDTILSQEDKITPTKLHHLLRLSALPLPKTLAEEASMLATLHSQLHFVRSIQSVDTDGVKQLQSIRDETEEGMREITIGMESLKEAFAKEEVRGRNKRPRRKRMEGNPERVGGVEDWDPLETARGVVERVGGSYFVVRSGKGLQQTVAENTYDQDNQDKPNRT